MIEPTQRRRSRYVVVVLAGVIAASAVGWAKRHVILAALFGPPAAVLAEAYRPDGPVFDHAQLDGLLSTYVNTDGWIDYQGLLGESAALDGYLDSIAAAPIEQLGRDERLALLINAYNAFTLKLIVENYPIEGIRSIPSARRWDDVRWSVGGTRWSLNQIEHEQIRPRFREPRIHFALVCAAVGCPPLRSEAYSASRLATQLEEQTEYLHRHRTWFELDADRGRVRLTQLYLWYGEDFAQTDDSLLGFVARYSSELSELLDAGRAPAIEWLDYDWKLNDKPNERPR